MAALKKRKPANDQWMIYNQRATEKYGSNKITFDQAKESGLLFYAGSDCLMCGNPYRYVSTRSCRRCTLENTKRQNYKERTVIEDAAKEVTKRTKARIYSLEDARIERELRGY